MKTHYYLTKALCRQNVPTDGFHGENREKKKKRQVLGGRKLRDTIRKQCIIEMTGGEILRTDIGLS